MRAVAEGAVGGVTAGTDGYRLRLGDIHGEGGSMPLPWCVPSQKGKFAERPQAQK